MKYLIMESSSGYAIALDEQGHFLKVANPGYEVGETVDSVILYNEVRPAILSARRVISLTAAAAGFMLVLGLSWIWLIASYGTVTMRINPAVRISLNRINYVTRIEALNEDGIALIDGYQSFGKDIARVSDELADRALDMNYLTDNGEITLEIDSAHERWESDLQVLLTNELRQHLPSGISIQVHDNDDADESIPHRISIPVDGTYDTEKNPSAESDHATADTTKPEHPKDQAQASVSGTPSTSSAADKPLSPAPAESSSALPEQSAAPSTASPPATVPSATPPAAAPSASAPPATIPVITSPAGDSNYDSDSNYGDSSYGDDDNDDDDDSDDD